MKRIFSAVLSLILLLGTAGCAVSAPPAESGSDETEPVTLDWYVNYSWYNTPWGGNAVNKAIMEKTGVDIRFISPDGSESETLDALIAGGSLPDLVTLGWWETQLTEIVDGGMAYPLNELADQYDPSFWTVADERRLAWYGRTATPTATPIPPTPRRTTRGRSASAPTRPSWSGRTSTRPSAPRI